MKVLIATWVFPTHGGVFNFLLKMIPRLEDREYTFHVVSVKPAPQSIRSFPHLPMNRIHHVGQLPLPSPFSFPLFGMIWSILRITRQEDIDLIFCQDPFYSGLPSVIASSLLGTPLAMADHGMITNFTRDEYWSNFGFRAKFLWRLLSFLVMKRVIDSSDIIYSPGEDITERISKFFGDGAAEKTSTFPIGIDTEVYRPDGALRKRVRTELGIGEVPMAAFVGRLHIESGMQYMIEAARLIPEETRPKFLIIGDGVLRAEYEREAKSKTPGSFMFIGYSERIPEYLKAADLFVFPKIFAGGYSVALREAMAAGLACVATAGVDSHDAIIENGRNGILVPPKDPEKLSAAIARLLSDEGRRREIAELARRTTIERYGIQSFHQRLEKFLLHHSKRDE